MRSFSLGQWTMIIANLPELAIGEFEHLGAHRLDNLVGTSSAMKQGFRPHRARNFQPSCANRSGRLVLRQTSLVMTPDLVASFEFCPAGIDDRRVVVEACHDALDIMAVERIEVALNGFLFGCHLLASQENASQQLLAKTPRAHVDRVLAPSALENAGEFR
jgi:hypothetical protein